MPWLVGTALIHSLAVTEKRGLFKSWTLLLAIIAFSLSLLGTFLVRSGVLVSVHAFASDPSRGLFILGFLGIVRRRLARAVLPGARPALRTKGGFDSPVARVVPARSTTCCCWSPPALILIGTLYPLFLDALNMGKISVGPPYFNLVFLIPMMPLLVAARRSACTRPGSSRKLEDSQGAARDACSRSRSLPAFAVPICAYGGVPPDARRSA